MSNNLKIIATDKCKNGYTLVEILVVVFIMMMALFVGADYIINGFRSTTFNIEQEDAIVNARNAVNIFTKEIRGANTSDNGSYTLDTIADQEFIFYSDINDDNSMEKVRYYLDSGDNELMKDVIAAGPARDYSQATTTSIIARYINNQSEPIFTYYDSNGATTTAIIDVRMIGISLKVNVTPSRAPNDYYIVANVTLRNLKSNL